MADMSSKTDADDTEQKERFDSLPDSETQPVPGKTRRESDYDRYHTQWDDDDRAPEARGRDSHTLAKDYWLSPRFLGSMAAVGLGFCGGTGGYALIAPVLTDINDDIGPSANITWVSIVYVLCEAVFFLLVGRLSDLFGRRWFFITGSLISLVGSIVGAVAQDVNTLIAAEVLIGISAAFQISFYWVISEIVPMKWRYLANSYAYMVTIPTNPLAAKIAYTFQQTPVKWRGSFYFMIGVNALSALCWFLFYHPPTFKMLHRKRLLRELLWNFDWIGLVLYTGSLTVFLLGLNWGGLLYPWNNSHTVSGLVVGGVGLFIIFPLWEIFLPFKGVEPFLPLHLFTNVSYQACAWLTGIGAATYYGFSLVWPQAVTTLYGIESIDRIGTLAGLVAIGFVFGQMIGGVVATLVGPRSGIICSMWIAAPLYLACSANPLDLSLTMGLITTGSLAIGIMEGQSIATTTFPLRTQEEIGTAGGLSGAIRSFVSVLATAIYSTVLVNRQNTIIPNYVPPAAEQAGLPKSSIPALIKGLSGKGPLTKSAVPGLTPAITAAATNAFTIANSEAYKTVFYTSFAFGGIGMILAFFVANNDRNLDDYVAGHVHKVRDEKTLEKEEG